MPVRCPRRCRRSLFTCTTIFHKTMLLVVFHCVNAFTKHAYFSVCVAIKTNGEKFLLTFFVEHVNNSVTFFTIVKLFCTNLFILQTLHCFEPLTGPSAKQYAKRYGRSLRWDKDKIHSQHLTVGPFSLLIRCHLHFVFITR